MAAIIHIGSDKAGSTALQSALDANRWGLSEHGFEYPQLGDGRPDHRTLAFELAAGRGMAGSLPLTDAVTVLSSEAFWPLDDQAITRLIRALGDSVTVIAYVRHPAAYAEAAFRQRCGMATSERQLRALLLLPALPTRVNPIATRAIRRYEQLRSWKAALQPGHLVVRPYEAGLPAQLDIVADFCSAAGVPASALIKGKRSSRQNVTPSLLALHASVLLRGSTDRETQLQFLRDRSAEPGAESDAPLTSASLREHVQRRAGAVLDEIDQQFSDLGWAATTQPEGRARKLDGRAARLLLTEHAGRQ